MLAGKSETKNNHALDFMKYLADLAESAFGQHKRYQRYCQRLEHSPERLQQRLTTFIPPIEDEEGNRILSWFIKWIERENPGIPPALTPALVDDRLIADIKEVKYLVHTESVLLKDNRKYVTPKRLV